MATLAGRRILTVGDRTYHWEDLVLCGHLWGEWPVLQRRVAAGLACLARLEELEEDDPDVLDDKDVEAAAAEFRYARDLLAAEDLEAWLERRGLETDAWLDWLQRSLLLERWSDDVEAIAEEFPADPADVEAAIAGEAVCTGLASSLATRLAGRAAIHARTADGPHGEDAAGALVGAVPGSVVEQGLPGLSGPACRQRLEHLARLEVAWRRFTATHVTPAAVRSVVEAHRLDWIRVTVLTVAVAARDMANEIVLCVRDDGRDLRATCAEAGQRVIEATWYLDETEGRLRDALVAARAGDLLGPLQLDEGFTLVAVLDKVWPAETDPDVRQRAERALLDRMVAREIEDRVTWHETL